MRHLAAALLAAFATSAGAADERGILITNVTLRADRVDVSWVTDVQPPYRAAVHVPRSVAIRRDMPVEYVDTSACSASIPLDTGYASVFVQVYKPNDYAVCTPYPHRMLVTEWNLYRDRDGENPSFTITDTTVPLLYDSRGVVSAPWLRRPVTLGLVGTRALSWLACTNDAATVSVVTTGPRGQEIVSYTNSVRVTRPAAASRFPGIRLERTSITGGFSVTATEAYSAHPHMSQAVLVRRGWLAPFGSESTWRDSPHWLQDGDLIDIGVPASWRDYVAYEYSGQLPH